MSSSIISALIITTIAGMATCVGALIGFFVKRTDKRAISFSLGFSAGLMIYISLAEILYHARSDISQTMGIEKGTLIATMVFFGGILLTALLDKAIGRIVHRHEYSSVDEVSPKSHVRKMAHAGIMTAIALALHNFPEGVAVFISSINDPKVGLSIAIAIALHNIPEGIAIAVPIYYATRSKMKAFGYAFIAGLIQPVGALAAYLILLPFITPVLLSCTYALVAGIMIYISFIELLPNAYRMEESSSTNAGLFAGMAVMAIALLMLQ